MTPYCASCGEPFQSQTLFDDHRVGKYVPDERRCLTPDEMLDKGWRFDGRTWRGPIDERWVERKKRLHEEREP